ncbi:MAG: phospholipid carrier-dependent glycosyltransferase [Candidatus Altiarchaeota archaeon]
MEDKTDTHRRLNDRLIDVILVILFLATVFHISDGVYWEDHGFYLKNIGFVENTRELFEFPAYRIRHIDEISWMHNTYMYYLFFKKRDLSHEDWHSPLVYDQPNLGKFVLGFSLDVFNHKVVNSSGGMISWHNSSTMLYYFPTLKGISNETGKRGYSEVDDDIKYLEYMMDYVKGTEITRISYEDYITARKTIFAFSVISAVLVMIICHMIHQSRIASFIGGEIFLVNGITTPTSQMVLPDMIYCFFSLITVILAFKLFEKMRATQEEGRVTLKAALISSMIGVSTGLALSVKFSAAFMIMTIFTLLAWYALIGSIKALAAGRRLPQARIINTAIIGLLVSSSFAFAFVCLNPYLYSDPVGNTYNMILHRVRLIRMQHNIEPEPTRIDFLVKRVFYLFFRGILLDSDYFPTPPAYYAFHLLFVYFGALRLFRGIRTEVAGGFVGDYSILGMLILIVLLTVGSVFHIDWIRYYLPFAMFIPVLISLGIERVVKEYLWFRDRIGR